MDRFVMWGCVLLLLFSCQEKVEMDTIGETEYYFDEKLSSISKYNLDNYWVGTETGDIYNFKGNSLTSYDLGEDRIYKIDTEILPNSDSIFWVAVRNSGLQKWRKKNKNQLEKVKTYHVSVKENHYSPYDFISIGNSIFLATSQGLYTLDKFKDVDYLSLLYPTSENGSSFIIHNICQYNENTLLASTSEGVLVYNIQNKQSHFLLKGQYVEHVSVYDNVIYSISKNLLVIQNIDGEITKKIALEISPKLFYKLGDVYYLLGAEEMLLSRNLEEFITVHLRRRIPISGRNIIVPDQVNDFTYLVTENAVWRIPNNIDFFKGSKAIKSSFTNEDNRYYLTQQNELYIQKEKQNSAKKIYSFPKEEVIQWMGIIDHELYFYNSENQFKKMNISDHWLKNQLSSSPKVVYQFKEKITAAFARSFNDKKLAYVGVQDGFYIIENDKITDIKALKQSYVTGMFAHQNSNLLYVSTLNDGVFYLDQNNAVKSVEETKDTFFIHDLLTTNTHQKDLVALTNHHIISQLSHDSIAVKGYNKLLYVNDSLFFALPEFGIQRFEINNNRITDSGIFYKDLRFNKNSTVSGDGKLLLSSTIGAMILNPYKIEDIQWVDFHNGINFEGRTIGLFFILVTVFSVIIGFSIFKRKKVSLQHINRSKKDLLKRVEAVITYYNHLDEAVHQDILSLKEAILNTVITHKNKYKVTEQFDLYSHKIEQLNRDITLFIPKKLDEQIQSIKKLDWSETAQRIALSEEAFGSGNMTNIKEILKENDIWLEKSILISNGIRHDIELLSGTLEINGLNEGLFTELQELKDNKVLSVDEVYNQYNLLKQKIDALNNTESSKIIEDYLLQNEMYFAEKISIDRSLSFINEYLKEIKKKLYVNFNIEILKQLCVLDSQSHILRNIDKIKLCTDQYRRIHDDIVKNNKNQINKKTDEELAELIERRTEGLTKECNDLISILYQEVQKTDKIVLDILKLIHFDGQQAKVLAILISDPKIKRTLIPGILGIYGNLNPVISRLMNDRIKGNEDMLKKYQKSSSPKSIFIHLIFNLLH